MMKVLFQILFITCLLSIVEAQSLQQSACWNEYVDRQLFGGTSQSSITQLSDCEALCFSLSGCYAFEYVDSNTGANAKCFTFTTTSVPGVSAPGVNHYISICNCTWTPYLSSQSYGGIAQNGISTLNQCQYQCIQQGPSNCRAIEWASTAPVNSQCFTFPTNDPPTLTSRPYVDHYIWNCPPTGSAVTPVPSVPMPTAIPNCMWVPVLNSNTIGGTLYTTATTIDACKSACISNYNCMYGFDWNPSLPMGQQCWLSTNLNIVNNAGITHYTYNCSSGSMTYWNLVYGYNSPMGVLQPTVYSVEDCKKACTTLSSCYYGFDWDLVAPIGQQCWLSIMSNLTVYDNTAHYTLTQASQTGSPIDTSNCVWFAIPNSNSPGGQVQPLYSNLADCQKYCRLATRAVCTGIDWNPNAFFKCWFSLSNYTNINGFPGVTHYNYSCPGDTAGGIVVTQPASTMLGWNCGYVPFYNSTSVNGVQKPAYTDQMQCQNQCTVQIACKAYEWRSDTSQCWFYTSSSNPRYIGTIAYRTYYLFVPC